MVWYDFAILALLVYTMWSGAQRGFVTQLAWIAALVLCFKFADKLAPMIEPQISVEQPLKHWIAMLILYLAFSLGCFMVARILNSWMEKAKFKDFDRHLGGLLGLLKGGVLAMVITFFAVTLSESLQATVMQSYTGPAACWVLDTIEPITPDHFKEYLEQYHDSLGGDAHESHLGAPTSLDEILGLDDDPSVPTPPGSGSGISDFFNEMTGSGTGSQFSPNNETTSDTSFSDLLSKLPQRYSTSITNQLQERWQQSSASERRNLLDQLDSPFNTQVPAMLKDFLAGKGTETGQGSGSENSNPPTPRVSATQLLNTLNAIGDIYGDRDYIVNEALTRLDGVPLEVQKAVIDDWYADWSFQRTDPDPTTARNTALDDRILSQLNKRDKDIWNQLSLELRQRLATPRR